MGFCAFKGDMMEGGFVKIPILMISKLPLNRPYTEIEASFSYQLSCFREDEKPYRYYAKLWQWTDAKTYKFISKQKVSKTEAKSKQTHELNQQLTEEVESKSKQIVSKKEAVLERKEKKHIYGKFKNVKLTEDQLTSLKEKFNGSHELHIERLSEGKEMKGYVYKNDYLAILKWSKGSDIKPKNNERSVAYYDQKQKELNK